MANSNSLIARMRTIYDQSISLFVQLLCQAIRWPTSVVSGRQIANKKVTSRTVVLRVRHGRNAFWAAMVHRPMEGGYVKRIT